MKTLKSNRIIILNDRDIFESSRQRVVAPSNGSSVIIPHICNNIGVFGGGFTGAIDRLYPVVKNNYELLGKTFLQKNPGHTQFISVIDNKSNDSYSGSKHKLIFANMIAQNGVMGSNNKRPINYAFLVKSMINVKTYILSHFDSESPVEIHAPKFGSGLAGGNWSFIQDLIEDIWGDLQVYVYNYKAASSRLK